jgi:ATP-binding cassette subfamily C (CFTR/MRP) protein 1
MIRGGLIGLIYHRAMNVQSGGHDDGNAVTLMGSDVSNLETVGEMAHETWGQVLEVMIGTGLLANQIGWVCPVPLFIIVRKSHFDIFRARYRY